MGRYTGVSPLRPQYRFRVIRKKTGYNIDIQLNEAITTVNDGKTHLHLDVDAELDKDELMSILKSVGLN